MPDRARTIPLIYGFFFLASTVSLILGALAWSRTNWLFLPLPVGLSIVATLLPPLAILILVATNFLNAPNLQQVKDAVHQFLVILSTAVATVAFTYLFPGNILSCHLEQQWQGYFQSRNSQAIRSIQDNFRCCGLRSVRDRAWPFKDRTHGDDACQVQLGYQQSCFAPWRQQHRIAAWMVITATIVTLAVQILFPRVVRRTSWLAGTNSGETNYRRLEASERVEEEDEDENHGESSGIAQSNAPYHDDWRD